MHFNVPIEDYFPWYSYSEKSMNLPIVNDVIYKIFVNAIPYKYNSLCSLWFKPSEDNYYIIPIGNWSSKSININTQSQTGSVSLNDESIKFSFDSWLEIEKVRLFYHLGLKEESDLYLSIINQIQKLMDITEYYRINILEDDNSHVYDEFFIRISNFADMVSRDNIIKTIDKSEIIKFISNYNGEMKFGHSLKSYLNTNGNLTPSQISKSRILLQREYMKSNENKICVIISGSQPLHEDIKSLGTRLMNEGYTLNYTDNDTVLYLL